MTDIIGTPEEVLKRVQALATLHMPDPECELQVYKTEIGCGSLDGRGFLHEVRWALRGLTEYRVISEAKAVSTHYAQARR